MLTEDPEGDAGANDNFDRVLMPRTPVLWGLLVCKGWCRVVVLSSLLMLSMIIIASVYSMLSSLPPTLSGKGCDSSLSPAHSRNRTVGTLMCAQHDTQPSTLIRKLPLSNLESVRFTVLGDFGRDGLCCQRDVAIEMAKACTAINCTFVLNVGDAFYTDGLESPDEEQVDTSWRNIYLNYNSLKNTPEGWVSLLGNHEYRGSPNAVLNLAQLDSRFFMPNRSYSKVFQAGSFRMLVVVLDTSPMIPVYHTAGFESDDKMLHSPDGITTQWAEVSNQLAWLRSTLQANSDVPVKIVCGHHPIYTSGSHYGEDNGYLRQHITPVLEEFNVAAYFSGHDHNLQYHHKSGSSVHYFGSAGGSKVEGSFVQADDGLRFFEQLNGFLAVHASKSAVNVAFVDYTGLVLFTVDIPVQAVQSTSMST